MATSGVMSMPVLERATGYIIGSISAHDLLAGRRRAVERESDRRIHFQFLRRRDGHTVREPDEAMERTLD
jgi:hypothetical protein